MCPALADAELNGLFAAAWPGRRAAALGPVLERSTAWIAARRDGRLVGYANVAGDGGAGTHQAFILDTTVHTRRAPARTRGAPGPRCRRGGAEIRGAAAARGPRAAPRFEAFSAQCGFLPTAAGLLPL
ncbi:GNAT family N-acetyltransferase [Streptomyces sp. NPDC006430]|uniref:GNAT family N-acetyltransferase n=1 Tax=Streptomyces sp. NPDC006430 TaxID=3154299 RepID=UPI0033B59B4A